MKSASKYSNLTYDLNKRDGSAINCSAFVEKVMTDTGYTIPKDDLSSQGIWANSKDKSQYKDWTKIPKDKLTEGTIIAFDSGEKGFDKGRKWGIDHIGVIVKKDGKPYILESSGSKKGVAMTPYEDRMKELNDSLVQTFIGHYDKPTKPSSNKLDTNSFVLDFETQAGGMSGGKAVGLSQYKDKKWASEIQDKYLGSGIFKDQFGNTKTGLKNENMFRDSWDKMDDKVQNQLTMYSFNSSWDPRVLAMQAAGALKPGERGKLHRSKDLTDAYWDAYQSKIDWKDPKLAQNMLNEMAKIYKNTYGANEDSSSRQLPANWPSYEARIKYIAKKMNLKSPV